MKLLRILTVLLVSIMMIAITIVGTVFMCVVYPVLFILSLLYEIAHSVKVLLKKHQDKDIKL